MYPAAYISEFGPGGAGLFYALLIFFFLGASVYGYWWKSRKKKMWARALKETRENRKSGENTYKRQ